MRDPYDILGVARGASFDEIRAAYRRASKTRHPDLGGTHESMVELNTAYAFVLDELKRSYMRQEEEAPRYDRAGGEDARAEEARRRQRAYRDIDEELEELHRAAQAHEETLRTMRAEAWESGDRATWAKLTWDDLSRFFRGLLNSGLKGVAVLAAALIGVGSVLVETNFVSSLIVLGSGIGFFLSLALKNDKGGYMSAGLLLFGLMTIWLPPVRAALFSYPLATISVLVCLGLIFKFGQQGGVVGLLTGGVLALYMIGVIVGDTQRGAPQTPSERALSPAVVAPTTPGSNVARRSAPPLSQAISPPTAARPSTAPVAEPPSSPIKLEPRTLFASKDALLKFVSGIPYRLKVRSGFTTSLVASQGMVAFYSGDERMSDCTVTLKISAPKRATPYAEVDRMIRACGNDAIVRVDDVR
ncbi:DnaJ domain-containing protein [Methylocystis sp. WRRC1]|uniref:DnaJ domain-containing protein n=1 Tax=Methylocystis sp. WRRC1 TaxID=1732014 RepID=UPI001D14794B|nr:DnaJ domain-containing protein [Methylocystis sp. WRRC1]MCC3246441.1 DnaJ domain-containing protein [Methylocystis sp. WRRC1]